MEVCNCELLNYFGENLFPKFLYLVNIQDFNINRAGLLKLACTPPQLLTISLPSKR
jgi:hypothetical protein